MSSKYVIEFSEVGKLDKATAVLLQLSGDHAASGLSAVDPQGVVAKAAKVADFSAKSMAVLDLLAPAGSDADRIVVIGLGKRDKLKNYDWLRAGGAAAAQFKSAETVAIYVDADGLDLSAKHVSDFALGLQLRSYSFDQYKTKKKDEDKKPKSVKVTIVTSLAREAAVAYADAQAVAGGVNLARELVNLPPNVLGPEEFADKARELSKLGVEVEILSEKDMKKLGMGALLGVGQGSARPPRMAVMQWKGGSKKEAPIAFVGKGVVFDTGGISLKPALNMEEMKGDMGGAAAVIGLMHTLAARKAKVNVVGVLGLVENMPDGNAQRPGDIVTSMSGQTIEIINTDAEGRLVLADALHYTNDRFKPEFMVNLATLTGAVMVALGTLHAGLFSNNDELADRLLAAGLETQERLWRLPLGKDYDKIIDSKFADMKNSGGRMAGSITAAQFLQRFVGDTPWAHLDVAGTAMDSPANEINQSWGSGYGVRLLDQLVRDHYEG